jgi:hypothetical protein
VAEQRRWQTASLGLARSDRCRVVWLTEGWDAAGMGESGAFGGGEGAAGLSWLFDKEPGGFRGGEQAGLDLIASEDATGDEAIEADSGLVQGAVAAAFGSVSDGGQLSLERGAAVGMASRGWAERCRGSGLRSLGSGEVEEAVQWRRRCGEFRGEWPQPPVLAASGMSGGWGDNVAAAATPVHVLQQAGPVAAAGWGQIEVPAASAPNQRSTNSKSWAAAKRRSAARPARPSRSRTSATSPVTRPMLACGQRRHHPTNWTGALVCAGRVGQGMLANGPAGTVAARAAHPAPLDGVRRDRMVQRKHPITELGVGQCGRAQLVGWPHHASFAAPLPELAWLVRNWRSSSRP